MSRDLASYGMGPICFQKRDLNLALHRTKSLGKPNIFSKKRDKFYSSLGRPCVKQFK